MIPDAELAAIRKEADQYLDRVGLWFAGTSARDASGGTVRSWAANPSYSTPVRLSPMDKKVESSYAERLGGRQGWIVTAPFGTAAAITSRLVVDGRTLEVVGSDIGLSYPMTTRVPVAEST